MRIRTVKPEFWSHPVMARLPADAQLLALALLNYADDEGYFLAEASLIRSACQPFRDDYGNTTVLVRTLIKAEWIQVSWNPDHGPIGRVTQFRSHQVVNKPKPSKLKQYWGNLYDYGNNPAPLPDSSGTRTVRNGMDQGMERKGREGEESAELPDPEGESEMGKKKIVVQEGLIPPALMESPDFMEAWTGFLEMRKEIKKPATEYAQKLLLRKLETMSGGIVATAVAILEQSVLSSWQDIYPLKTNGNGSGGFQRGGAVNGHGRPDLAFLDTNEGHE